jgi:phage FluMu protein Com
MTDERTPPRKARQRATGARDRDLRCPCGSLMARVTIAGVELKCRRCKRVVVLTLTAGLVGWTEVSPR